MFAVSFCNNTRGKTVKLLNEDLSLARDLNCSGSTTGLVKVGDFLYCANRDSHLLRFDLRDFQLKDSTKTRLKDLHSLYLFEGDLYAASTGNDTVFRFELSGNALSKPAEKAFSFNTGRDGHHINGISHKDGQVVFSCFGPKTGNWIDSVGGRVCTLQGEVIYNPIEHPHSVMNVKDDLYYLESRLGNLYKNDEVLFQLEGYTRGLVVEDDSFLVGISASRNEGVRYEKKHASILRVDMEGNILNISTNGFDSL